jgi:hypothetical protein
VRHADWKILQKDPVVLKAQEALKRVQQELASDAFWKDSVTHLAIFPDPNRTNVLQLIVTDFALIPLGQPPLTRREIAWEEMDKATQEEAEALVLAGIRKFRPDENEGDLKG